MCSFINPTLLYPHAHVTRSLFLFLPWLSSLTLPPPQRGHPPHPKLGCAPTWVSSSPCSSPDPHGRLRPLLPFAPPDMTTTLQNTLRGCPSQLSRPWYHCTLALTYLCSTYGFKNKYSRMGNRREGRERKRERREVGKGRSMNIHLRWH